MSSLFGVKTIGKIKDLKKVFLWAAVCILIGEVIIGAVLILAQNFNVITSKLTGTLTLCTIALFIGVNNFSRMEKGEKLVQGFALAGLITSMIWLVLAILLVWEVAPMTETVFSKYDCEQPYLTLAGTTMDALDCVQTHLTVVAKIMWLMADAAVMCFVMSNVWSIEETVRPVKPLKIAAILCGLYCGIYGAVTVLSDTRYGADSRWYALAGLLGLAFVVMGCAAAIVSRSGAKKEEKVVAGEQNMNDEGMQAKIQEMVEKEVQARLAAQRAPEVGGEPRQVPDSIYPKPRENGLLDDSGGNGQKS